MIRLVEGDRKKKSGNHAQRGGNGKKTWEPSEAEASRWLEDRVKGTLSWEEGNAG